MMANHSPNGLIPGIIRMELLFVEMMHCHLFAMIPLLIPQRNKTVSWSVVVAMDCYMFPVRCCGMIGNYNCCHHGGVRSLLIPHSLYPLWSSLPTTRDRLCFVIRWWPPQWLWHWQTAPISKSKRSMMRSTYRWSHWKALRWCFNEYFWFCFHWKYTDLISSVFSSDLHGIPR